MKTTKKPTAAQLRKLSRSNSLFQITITDRHGKKRQGTVLRPLEAYGYIDQFNRMVDVTGGKIEVEPVVAVPAPPGKRRAAMREIAAFI